MLDALDMALHQRQPEGVIHHSDQDTQYTSIAFGHRCCEADVGPSMGSVGDAYDNALCESFFESLECELIDRITLRTFTHGRREVFDYIGGWYNPQRRRSASSVIEKARTSTSRTRECSLGKRRYPLERPDLGEASTCTRLARASAPTCTRLARGSG